MFGLACARVARRAPPAVAYLHSTAPFTTAASLAPRRLHVSASIIALGKTSPVTAPPTTASLRFTQVRGYAEGGRKETNEELLDRLTREAKARGRAFDATHEHVGPFPLGVGPSGRNKTWTRWGDLGLGGKLVRTVRQSGNLLVVLFGGGLFVILTLALTTELFAKNSPAVLYSECIDLIRDTDALSQFLLPPLKFTHSPNAASPVRGSTPVVHRVVRSPYNGRDHLLITFWVHGRSKDDPEPSAVGHWVKEHWENFYAWAREKGGVLGLAVDPDTPEPGEDEATKKKLEGEVQKQEGWLASLASGLGLRPRGRDRNVPQLPPAGTFTIGECHADYVKDEAGQYRMLSLVVDVPSSRARRPYQAVVYWSQEAQREGLVPRR